MAKKLGLSANRCFFVGRIVGNPEITGDWAKMFMKTIVPENQNGNWVELDCIVPMMTNNPRTIDTIQKFIQDERQLIVEGYVTSWQNQQGSVECAVMITNIKLGSQKMFDPDAPQENMVNRPQGSQPDAVGGNMPSGGSMPGFPS